MKKLFCGIVCGICATCNAYAGLIPTSAQDAASMIPGSDCYSDDGGMLKIAKVDCVTWDGSRLFEKSWSDGAWEECDPYSEYDGLCYLGEYGGAHYFCYDGGTRVCDEAGCPNGYIGWTTGNTTGLLPSSASSEHIVTRLEQTLYESDYYSCMGAFSTFGEYGCASGYYRSGGSTNKWSSDLTCSQCPTAGGTSHGTSEIGNRSGITACYMQYGNNFADSTGSGVFDGTCNWTN